MPAKRPAPTPKKHPSRRIVVLSRNSKLYSTTRLAEAARKRGDDLRVVDTLGCTIVVDPAKPLLLYKGRAISCDVVIPRIGASVTNYGLAVVRHFEAMGVAVMNSSHAIACSRDKLRCLQTLARAGINVPKTVMARDRTDVRDAVKRVGGLPAIVKLTKGTQGIGVMIAHTMAEMESILDTMWDLGQEVIVQEFVQESRGRDVRVLVVGGEAIGAMRRTAKKGEFRSNIHRGGEGEAIDLTPEYAACAVAAAHHVGMEVAGVDLLESSRGPQVLEVNSSPGFEGLEGATGLAIAERIIERAAKLAENRG